MAYTVFVHLTNEDPLLLEIEALPGPTDTLLIGRHPRRRDNKDVHFILAEVTTVIFPLTRISFIEVMPTGEDEEIFLPYRPTGS
jgi:hypothetical protein